MNGSVNGKRMQGVFYGLNHTPGAGEGEIFDCGNLTADYFPLLAPRRRRGLFKTLTKANGLAGRDVLMWVDGTEFFYNGVKKGTVSDCHKDFYFIGPYVIIWPDKAFYNILLDSFGNLEESYLSGAGQISFCDGTYAGIAAKSNCIVTTGTAFAFELGDAITISGCTDTKNNIVAIIREISEDKKTLRFYENTFHIASGTSFTEAGSITLARKVPNMDFLCENENRLWGCHGDDIFCCNLGNPKVWMDYDALSTGSYSVGVGSAGDFTGCMNFGGYAIFTKEANIHKAYGTKPTDFKVLDSATGGILSGCNKSCAIAGETLFYRSRAGICRYSGGYPYAIDVALGEMSPRACVGGSDGRKYYVSGLCEGKSVLLCYDTRTKTWLREDACLVTDFAYADGLYFLTGNEIWKVEGGNVGTLEGTVKSFAEFGDFYEGSPQRKGLAALQIRAELATGATLSAFVSYDGGAFVNIGTISGDKQMHKLPMVPRRCDFWRLRLEGVGDYKVYAIAREYSEGSDIH
ncbi:MAG: hypothetical protein RR394_05255 [Oscillospiraceae bacterium]